MKNFNDANRVVVANTYQCYLRETAEDLRDDLALSEKKGFSLVKTFFFAILP